MPSIDAAAALHASRHAAGGPDQITPASIGALPTVPNGTSGAAMPTAVGSYAGHADDMPLGSFYVSNADLANGWPVTSTHSLVICTAHYGYLHRQQILVEMYTKTMWVRTRHPTSGVWYSWTKVGSTLAPAEIGAVPASRFRTGTGSPEGVVTAPVGTTYTDTAATTGGVEWTKWTGTGNTGWRVTKGDTGWVILPAASFAANCSPYGTGVRLRRTDVGVFLTAEVAMTGGFISGEDVFTVPAWAAPSAGAWAPPTGYAGQTWWWGGLTVKFANSGASPARRTGTHFYPTEAAWPTTLTI